MSNKIAIAACGGMSPNGLISRVASADAVNETPNTISICMGATSGDKTGFSELIKKYPIIAVNGCESGCVNKILLNRGVKTIDSIDITAILNETPYKANDVSRLDDEGEKCVKIIKNTIQKLIKTRRNI